MRIFIENIEIPTIEKIRSLAEQNAEYETACTTRQSIGEIDGMQVQIVVTNDDDEKI